MINTGSLSFAGVGVVSRAVSGHVSQQRRYLRGGIATGDSFEKGKISLGGFGFVKEFALYSAWYCLNALFPEFIFWIPEPACT